MALEVGSRLGHYDVTALIGEGGMRPDWRVSSIVLGDTLLAQPAQAQEPGNVLGVVIVRGA